jgi:hypothetical protein
VTRGAPNMPCLLLDFSPPLASPALSAAVSGAQLPPLLLEKQVSATASRDRLSSGNPSRRKRHSSRMTVYRLSMYNNQHLHCTVERPIPTKAPTGNTSKDTGRSRYRKLAAPSSLGPQGATTHREPPLGPPRSRRRGVLPVLALTAQKA